MAGARDHLAGRDERRPPCVVTAYAPAGPPADQWIWRTYPQMAQRAVPISESTSRKLGQPLVSQYGRVTACARRRMRRMEEARPVMDAVAERGIMVCVSCAFWRAVIAGWAIGCAAGGFAPWPCVGRE